MKKFHCWQRNSVSLIHRCLRPGTCATGFHSQENRRCEPFVTSTSVEGEISWWQGGTHWETYWTSRWVAESLVPGSPCLRAPFGVWMEAWASPFGGTLTMSQAVHACEPPFGGMDGGMDGSHWGSLRVPGSPCQRAPFGVWMEAWA